MALSRRSEGGGFHHPSHSTDYTALILIITLLFAVSFVRTSKYTGYLSTGDLRHFRIFEIEIQQVLTRIMRSQILWVHQLKPVSPKSFFRVILALYRSRLNQCFIDQMSPLKTNKITSLIKSLVFHVICLQVRFFHLIYPIMFPSGNQEIINVYNIKR